jgi:hypothetical protein
MTAARRTTRPVYSKIEIGSRLSPPKAALFAKDANAWPTLSSVRSRVISVHAAMTVAKLLEEGSPAKNTKTVLTLVYWASLRDRTPHPPTSVAFSITQRLKTSKGNVVEAGAWVRVPLKPAATVSDQFAAAFGTQGFDIATAEDGRMTRHPKTKPRRIRIAVVQRIADRCLPF